MIRLMAPRSAGRTPNGMFFANAQTQRSRTYPRGQPMFSPSTAFQRSASPQGGRPHSPQELQRELQRDLPRERPRSLPSETWTPERVEQLERGYHAGRSCAKIAEEIGVTRNAVIGKLN